MSRRNRRSSVAAATAAAPATEQDENVAGLATEIPEEVSTQREGKYSSKRQERNDAQQWSPKTQHALNQVASTSSPRRFFIPTSDDHDTQTATSALQDPATAPESTAVAGPAISRSFLPTTGNVGDATARDPQSGTSASASHSARNSDLSKRSTSGKRISKDDANIGHSISAAKGATAAAGQRGESDLPLSPSSSFSSPLPQSKTTTAIDVTAQGLYPPRSKSVYEGDQVPPRLRSRSSLPSGASITSIVPSRRPAAHRHDEGRGDQQPSQTTATNPHAARRSSRRQKDGKDEEEEKDDKRRLRPLRSLTPSSSLPNLSSSAAPLPSSHSYPFLAEAPPERPSIRQRRRLASMPTSRTVAKSRSRSPPLASSASTSAAAVPFQAASSSRPKRSREVVQSSSSRGHASTSSKRVASGSSIPVVPQQRATSESEEEEEDDDDDDNKQGQAPPMEYHQGKKYELIIVQEPTRGCAFGSNLLSRLPCAPPLIVQLKVTDEAGNEVASEAEEPFLVCHASLFTSEGQSADLLSPIQSTQTSPSTTSGSTPQVSPALAPRRSPRPRRSSRGGAGAVDAPSTRSRQGSISPATPQQQRVPSTPVRMLYGSLAATPQKFPSPEGDESILKTYFIFPEVCVRAKGKYQIRLALMKLPSRRPATTSTPPPSSPPPPPPTTVVTGSDLLATTRTSTFQVFLAHEYVVPYVTDVTRFFARHGAALPLPSGDRTEG